MASQTQQSCGNGRTSSIISTHVGADLKKALASRSLSVLKRTFLSQGPASSSLKKLDETKSGMRLFLGMYHIVEH